MGKEGRGAMKIKKVHRSILKIRWIYFYLFRFELILGSGQ